MQRILIFKNLTEADKHKIETLLENEPIQYEISIPSKSLTLQAGNDELAYVKRLLLNHHFEIL